MGFLQDLMSLGSRVAALETWASGVSVRLSRLESDRTLAFQKITAHDASLAKLERYSFYLHTEIDYYREVLDILSSRLTALERPVPTPPDISDYVAKFATWHAADYATLASYSIGSADNVDQLGLVDRAIDAYADMHEATGEDSYLDTALTLIRNAISTAYVKAPSPYLSWYRTSGQHSWQRNVEATKSWMRVCRLDEARGTRESTDISSFVRTNILSRYLDNTTFGDPTVLLGRTWCLTQHMLTPPSLQEGYWQGIQDMTARIAWDFSRLDGTETDFANAMVNAFLSILEPLNAGDNGSLVWDEDNNQWTDNAPAMDPDAFHSNRRVRWIIEAWRDEGVATSVVQGLAKTLTLNIYAATPSDPYLKNYITGSDANFGGSGGGQASIYDGWAHLSAVSTDVQAVAQKVYDVVVAGAPSGNVLDIHSNPWARMPMASSLALGKMRMYRDALVADPGPGTGSGGGSRSSSAYRTRTLLDVSVPRDPGRLQGGAA